MTAIPRKRTFKFGPMKIAAERLLSTR